MPTWGNWGLVTAGQPPVGFAGAPTAASWASNRIDLLCRGCDQALYHSFWTGTTWSAWENLGGVLTASPSTCSWGANRLDVICRGLNGALYHKYWNGVGWSVWESLGGQLMDTPPTITSWGVNRLDVFAVGTDNGLWHKWWDGVTWHDWEEIGFAGSSAGGTGAAGWTTAQRIDVTSLAYNGTSLLYKYYLAGWQPAQTSFLTSVVPGSWQVGVTMIFRPASTVDVFGVSPTQTLQHAFSLDSGNTWAIEDLGGALLSQPGVSVQPSVPRIDVFGCGNDGQMYQKTWV